VCIFIYILQQSEKLIKIIGILSHLVETVIGGKGKGLLLVETCYAHSIRLINDSWYRIKYLFRIILYERYLSDKKIVITKRITNKRLLHNALLSTPIRNDKGKNKTVEINVVDFL
jgi:hypothetical protein